MYYFNYTLNETQGVDQGELFILNKEAEEMARRALYQRLEYTRYIYS